MPAPVIAIDGEWYDLNNFYAKHPGGKQILDNFNGADATDAFYSLHSENAIKQLKLMKPIESKRQVPEPKKIDKAFRALKTQLEAEGWWSRDALSEAKLILPIVAMCAWGTVYSYTYPLWSMLAISVAMCQAGWLGHDMTHARNSKYCDTMLGFVTGWVNGFDRTWWSRKHNTHHVLTNHIGVDPDIDMMPAIFLWAPSKELDHHFRKWQHFYALPLYSLLYVTWRFNSLEYAIRKNDRKTLFYYLLPGYVWLLCMPWIVSMGSVLLGGWLVAVVVVQSHEAEEMFHTSQPLSFVETQFKSTIDIVCPDPVTEYWFGGMQYQLSHHLFPTMPRYKYPALQPVLEEWGKKNGLAYRKVGLIGGFIRHFSHLRENALKTADEGCISNGWSAKALD
eukprot:CAMPEP_0182926686 /NCGR_PEP_ID=MMETSP0105_2-20130417/12210_1 /TAXON_ID=81532 ORGANISM="Acanthoeca-like sp., Strain 10tr" /NCGR_SAMPLE_ID=MMETSP0105_2 /ASSEMBLY_ACC=CAM_ASM_000205 /LENGTH=392 /DNA_ID=CAMNT_0025064587 /DNA_START=16 /DNA_END=1194 /DNA_ORIENTATION=-